MGYNPKNVAIGVMKKSRIVSRWVESQAKAYGIDLNTPEGKEFYDKMATKMARKLVR